MIQELLQKHNLKYEDLNYEEKQTLTNWLEGVQKNTLTVDSIREYITHMKDALGAELAGLDEPKSLWEYLFRRKRDVFRRARLKNYILLLNMLSGPEKAAKALEKNLQNIKPKSNAV